MSRVDEPDLKPDDYFARGRELGQREGYQHAISEWQTRSSPFRGVPAIPLVTSGARYEFQRSYFDSFLAYERQLVEALRAVQFARWKAQVERSRLLEELVAIERGLAEVHEELETLALPRRWWLKRSRPWMRDLRDATRRLYANAERMAALRAFQRHTVLPELAHARAAVDVQLSEGHGRGYMVEGLRRPPNRPDGVREFLDLELFVAEDPRRALPDWPHRRDAGGEDYGYDWSLENPLRRWETTRWRLSWLRVGEATHEVYAIELRTVSGDSETRTGRVWLCGQIRERRTFKRAVEDLERYAQRERNSLVVVAEAVRDAVRREARALRGPSSA